MNTEEENNGYDVVFKGNIHGSAWKKGGGRGEGLLRRPNPVLQQVYGQIFKDDINVFFSFSDICFMHFMFLRFALFW
jgi:hypothetical protein